jgi:hypothetical protein
LEGQKRVGERGKREKIGEEEGGGRRKEES